ncbi:MAG: hypothetical protein RR959_08035 [Erysipelotrichaceae bacterium]
MTTQTINSLNLPFGLAIITKYSCNNVTATLKHGCDIITKAKVSYDCQLNSSDAHLQAALKCLEKVKTEHEKEFEIVYYTYNEKDTGYSFIVKRIN